MSVFPSPVLFGDDVHDMAPAAPGSPQVRTIFSSFPAAVGALCAVVDGELCGMIATSLSVGVSYDPPMVLFSVRNDSTTWPILRTAGRIGISVLSQGQHELCRQLASKNTAGRFAGLDVQAGEGGALFIGGASTWLNCEVSGDFAAGDHTVITFLVNEVGHSGDVSPLVFHNGRFPRLVHDEMS